MSNPSSELVEISKLNGSFKRNYGTFLGAFLYYARSALRVAALSVGGLL
jgi:hypothetical protein